MKITNWQQLVRVKVKAISEKIEMAFLLNQKTLFLDEYICCFYAIFPNTSSIVDCISGGIFNLRLFCTHIFIVFDSVSAVNCN